MERKRVQARLSDEARRGWDRAARPANLSALMEAVGLWLDRGDLRFPPELLAEAQEIEVESRKRY